MSLSVVPTATVLWQIIALRGKANETTFSTMLVSHAPFGKAEVGTQMNTKSVSTRSDLLPRPFGGSYIAMSDIRLNTSYTKCPMFPNPAIVIRKIAP